MAFNLKKVLRALLFSSSQPLSIKDIQTAFTRFHEVGTKPAMELESADAPAEPILEESDEIDITDDEDLELYGEVPSLVTAAQIREAMDELSN